LARRLDAYGLTVYAGCLFPNQEAAQELVQSCSNQLKVIKLDVTNDEDVKSIVDEINSSGLELIALVNNAGMNEYSMIEWGKDLNTFEKLFRVNVFGLIRVTKMCLPMLRKSRGRVINMASTAGKIKYNKIF
jgi:short-subunit dehydrogenase